MSRQENDTIYRQETTKHLKHRLYETAANNPDIAGVFSEIADNRIETWIEEVPSAGPEPTYEQVMEYCKKRCLSLVANEFLAYMFSHSAQPEYTEQDVRDSFNSGYACGMEAAQPEIIRCKDCRYWVAHDKRCVYLNHGFAPNMWCCHAERRTDG